MPITEFASLEFKASHSLSEPSIYALFQRLSAWQSECSGFPLRFFTNPEVPSEIHLITGWDGVEAHEAWIAGERNQELLKVFSPLIDMLGMVHLDIDFERIPGDASLVVCLEYEDRSKGQVEGEVRKQLGVLSEDKIDMSWAEVGRNMQEGRHEVYVLASEGVGTMGGAGLDIRPVVQRKLQRVEGL
ncbi:hypothetical protein V8B97DRAFT_1351826 [Scleroderma yunnanense]